MAWDSDNNANKLKQSYVKDFIDVSGSVILRDTANLIVNGNANVGGNVYANGRCIMNADLSYNKILPIGGDVSFNQKLAVAGDVSMNGKILSCNLAANSIPQNAFNGTVSVAGPDYTKPSIIYNGNLTANNDVSLNGTTTEIGSQLNINGNITFSDGTTMTSYDNNIVNDFNVKTSRVATFTFDASYSGIFPQYDKGLEIRCSSNGKYVALAVGNWNNANGITAAKKSGILLSTNYGITFNLIRLRHPVTREELIRSHFAMSMSLDGQYMLAGVTGAANASAWNDSVIGFSTDYGATWETYFATLLLGVSIPHTTGTFFINGLAMNADASVIVISITNGSGATNATYISTNRMLSFYTSANYIWDQYYNNIYIVNKRIISGEGAAMASFRIYDLSGNILNTYQTGVGSYSQKFRTSLATNTVFATNNSIKNIQKIINIDTSPTIIDISNVNTSNYLGPGIVISPSGKNILIGATCNTVRPTTDLSNVLYFSNDYGTSFTTISAIGTTNANTRSIALSDNGHLFILYGDASFIYTEKITRYKKSTYTALTVNGTLTSGSYVSSSDYRIKTNVSPLNEMISIDNLRPVKYMQTLINKPQYGLIAHELQQYFPDLVTGIKDGESWQSVNYTGLISILINEIKQLKAELIELDKSIA